MAISDLLATGTYNLFGKDITDVKTGVIAYSDTLQVGSYVIVGSNLTDVYARTDVLLTGVYGGTTSSTTNLSYWNGTAWIMASNPLKHWDGSAWV